MAYIDLARNLKSGGLLQEMVAANGKDFVFYCVLGERSAMAVQVARDAGFKDARHTGGGVDAWDKENGPLGIPV